MKYDDETMRLKDQEKAAANMVPLPVWLPWLSGFAVGLVAGAVIVLVMVL